MFQLDLRNRKPIYEQVADRFRDLILSGVLAPDDRLPSVRELSKELTVNPNTVQKAYRELERQSYIYIVQGLGAFAEKPESRKPDAALRAEAERLVRRGVRELCRSGVPRDEIRAFLDGLPEQG
ncbi:MAG: GntR family transcriptional regulator [Clostridiales Family XIII bacterium]|jgi:GntR family transcriptional regulator|nr:GntR family transcriptional regulator [Clostridiales Family XIII bacterium]